MSFISSEILISSKIRESEKKGIFVSIIRKGETKSGALIVEIELSKDKSSLYGRRYNLSGNYEWYFLTKNEISTRDEVIQRINDEIKRDPDCWVISVQNSKGINIFDN